MKKLTFILLVFFIGRTVYSQTDNNLINEIKMLIDNDEAKAFYLIDSLIQIEDKSDYFYIENRKLCEIPKLDDNVIEFYKSKLLQDSLLYDYYSKVGSHYFNLGIEILGTEYDPPLDNYKTNIETGELYLEKAFPYILQAYKLNTDNENVYKKLLVLYYRFHMTEQYEELKEKKPNL